MFSSLWSTDRNCIPETVHADTFEIELIVLLGWYPAIFDVFWKRVRVFAAMIALMWFRETIWWVPGNGSRWFLGIEATAYERAECWCTGAYLVAELVMLEADVYVE